MICIALRLKEFLSGIFFNIQIFKLKNSNYIFNPFNGISVLQSGPKNFKITNGS